MLFKNRNGLVRLGKFGGHEFYRIEKFGDNLVNRYQHFIIQMQSFEKYGIEKKELQDGLAMISQALVDNKPSLAAQYVSALSGYVSLNVNNDVVFNTANCFILIDDEPIGEITTKHTELKKKLFNENKSVFVFFCEVFKTFEANTKNSLTDISLVGYLESRLARVTQEIYLNAMKKGSLPTS